MTATPPTPVLDNARTDRPPRRAALVAGSVLTGVLLAVLWSYELVDHVIGDNVANTLLGRDAKATAIAGTGAGLLFAFVSGLAGTFTACNIAVAASVGPLSHASTGTSPGPARRYGLRLLLRPLGWLALGMVAVSATYGAIGVLVGDALPQLSTDRVGDMPVRILQSVVVFGIIGLAFVYLGLATLGVVRDPFANRPAARVVVLGALVGGFLIGRPYPLFNKLFHWAVDTGNPVYGAGAFVLQSLGNVVLVAALFVLLAVLSRGRLLRWLAADPARTAAVSGALLLALGVFTVVYWDLRVPSLFGVGWFPSMPYN
ncbi:Cytochrome C biogenesis protein transmembrane region [Micromonospora nigra]|uniref:Cytochrome C biogenesis protein transmembrane region n=1 Tax=Micromonospora nigra TaxID=145857 RepID=A0A1C6SXZ6_9ACTN|nr:hypothetical protein [Micromonospora nigra]SCL34426.1 Cytochrome C biogenesis protein transmembrane region [Micromonospora nigra]